MVQSEFFLWSKSTQKWFTWSFLWLGPNSTPETPLTAIVIHWLWQTLRAQTWHGNQLSNCSVVDCNNEHHTHVLNAIITRHKDTVDYFSLQWTCACKTLHTCGNHFTPEYFENEGSFSTGLLHTWGWSPDLSQQCVSYTLVNILVLKLVCWSHITCITILMNKQMMNCFLWPLTELPNTSLKPHVGRCRYRPSDVLMVCYMCIRKLLMH